MITKEIPPQTCLICSTATDTKIICDGCRINLTPSQRQKYDGIYQRTVIELFGNECVDCGHMAETESGELCAAHLQGKAAAPETRYDLAASVCRCMNCHTDEHKALIPKVPAKEKMPKQTQEKQKKRARLAICARCRVLWASPGKSTCWKCT